MDKCFVLEPSNGYWGFAYSKKAEIKLREHLLSLKKPAKCYKGTQALVLNTTNQCNLGCIYCSTRELRSPDYMKFDVAKKVVDESLTLEHRPKIIFHGSEPLLNWSLIKETVKYGRKLAGYELDFCIQSNLTLLTSDKEKFIGQQKIGVSTSFDGREQEHNKNRPFADGKATYETILGNIGRIKEIQGGIHVITVITPNNVKNLEDIALDFEAKGITSVQFIPSVACFSDRDTRPSNKDLAESYINLFGKTFDRIEKGEQKLKIVNLVQYLSAFLVHEGTDSCRFCTSSNEHALLAVDINGDIYPCDFFFGNKQLIMGNILQDSLDSMINSQKNIRTTSIEETSCNGCDWKNICGGGCLADRVFSGGHPHYCEANRKIFTYLSKNMAHLVDSGIAKRILA